MTTAEEYFGDLINVIDKTELYKIMKWLKTIDNICPAKKNIFKAFRLCPYNKCHTIILSQDPYPQEGVATGITFGNSKDTVNLSPSLQVIKEAVINYELPHNHIEFDNTLESWAEQGILMLNSALTCEVNKVGSHFDIWKSFISKLLYNMSTRDGGLIYVLFGSQAKSFKGNIVKSLKTIEVNHPAYYARIGSKMPSKVFMNLKELIRNYYKLEIKFYNEYIY